MTATDLEHELARLAESIDPPPVPVSSDLARGRRRLLRTRLTVAGAAVGTAAVLGAATLLGQGVPQSTPAPVDRTPDGQRTVEAEAPVRALPSISPRNTHAATLSRWNDILAEHLDPQRGHLQPFTLRTSNSQSGDDYLGSRFGWTNAGESGLGMLQVDVAGTRAGSPNSPCVTGQYDLTCRAAEGPDGESAQVGISESVTTVELEQSDGDVVTLTLDRLFGNNSRVPISGSDITPEQLLEAAADERLDLPEPPPVSSVDPADFQRALVDLADGLELVGFPGEGSSLFEGALYDGRRQVGVLTADAFPTSSGYGLPSGCDRREFLRCERREVDGHEVWLGWVDAKYYPGVQVVLAGPENVVRAQWQRAGTDGAAPDVDRLVGLVTDPRWQS